MRINVSSASDLRKSSSDEDIDGETLMLLQHEDIVKIFPRIKDRVKFIDLRAKLIANPKEYLTDNDTIIGTSQHNGLNNSCILITNTENISGQTSDVFLSNMDSIDVNNCQDEARLPVDYSGPALTKRMQDYIDDNNISKFNPHTQVRSELLSLIFNDVTQSYKLLYPNHDEYMTMAKCIVNKLHIAPDLVLEATKEWHESIKQKFKCERQPLQMSNKLVREKQNKFGNGKTNGRPKRKSVVAQAERRVNDIPFINLNDGQNENLSSLIDEMKIELFKDYPDNNILHALWRQSFNIRRLCVRQLPIDELIERFPGYRRAELILAEVKESTGIDMNENVNELLPKLWECLPNNNSFLSDVLPIRMVRILCKIFGDPIGNVLTYKEVLVPYPCIKVLEDKFQLHLDFHPVCETDSCTTAMALLISLFYIFEIRFGQHNRCCRLLYGVLFEDTHYLNKGLKKLLNDCKYKITNRPVLKQQAVITSITDRFTQPSVENQNTSYSFSTCNQVDQQPLDDSQPITHHSVDLNLSMTTNTNQNFINYMNDTGKDECAGFDDEHFSPNLSITASPTNNMQTTSPSVLRDTTLSNINSEISMNDLDFNNNNNNKPHPAEKSSCSEQFDAQHCVYEENIMSSSNSKRKRGRKPLSSSSITLQKQSDRLAAKRIRLN